MQLHKAEDIAQRVVSEIESKCERVMIAGSVRRKKPEVKDIEIVAIPKIETRSDETWLFPKPLEVNLLHEWAQNDAPLLWIKPGCEEIVPWTPKPDGKYWRGLLPLGCRSLEQFMWGGPNHKSIKLDFFLTTPECWGAISTIRTGSADFSAALVTRARNMGMRCQDGRLISYGEMLDTPEERDFFKALGLNWIPPNLRSGPAAMACAAGNYMPKGAHR